MFGTIEGFVVLAVDMTACGISFMERFVAFAVIVAGSIAGSVSCLVERDFRVLALEKSSFRLFFDA